MIPFQNLNYEDISLHNWHLPYPGTRSITKLFIGGTIGRNMDLILTNFQSDWTLHTVGLQANLIFFSAFLKLNNDAVLNHPQVRIATQIFPKSIWEFLNAIYLHV